MKFDYEDKKPDSDIVAFIDEDGDLWVKSEEDYYTLNYAGDLNFQDFGNWSKYLINAKRTFVKGDKITITF